MPSARHTLKKGRPKTTVNWKLSLRRTLNSYSLYCRCNTDTCLWFVPWCTYIKKKLLFCTFQLFAKTPINEIENSKTPMCSCVTRNSAGAKANFFVSCKLYPHRVTAARNDVFRDFMPPTSYLITLLSV